MSKTQLYIEEAIRRAKEELAGTSIANCQFEMHLEASGATQLLAEALMEQAKANQTTSEAMLQLAKTLKPTEACAVRVTDGRIRAGTI